MIAIYREEIRELLRAKKINEAEDIWLQLLDEDPSDTELFIGLSTEFANKDYAKEASALLAMNIPYLLENGYYDRAINLVKQMAAITPHDKETSARIIECYSLAFKDFPNIQEIISVSRANDITQNLPKSIECIENFISFKEGDFCKHNSWGIGQITSIDFFTKTLTIDFNAKKNHRMDIELGVRALTGIDDQHISALKFKKMPYLKNLAQNDPVELLKITLKSHDNNKATLNEIIDTICGDIIEPDEWKKWWDKTKKLLKSDEYITIPEKKQKYYTLLDQPVSIDEQILSSYFKLSNFREKLAFISAKLKKQSKETYSHSVIDSVAKDLGEMIEINHTIHPALALEAWYTLFSLINDTKQLAQYTSFNSKAIFEHAQNLMETVNTIEKLDFQKEALKDIKAFFPKRWQDIYLDLLTCAPSELIDDIIDEIILNDDNTPKLDNILKMGFDLITENEELLLWIAKNLYSKKYKKLLDPFSNVTLIEKLIDSMDLLHSGVLDRNDKNAKNILRIKDLLFKNNCAFTAKILAASDAQPILHVAHTIVDSSSLDKLNQQALLAKFIIYCPAVKNLMKSEEVQNNAIYSSKEAFDQKQREFYELVNTLIPQNAKNIGIARAHGDLRENFEYKAAKEEQAKLLRRKMEFENIFNKIRIIDFNAADSKKVSLATTVRVLDTINHSEKIFNIMGIWDSAPEKGTISYLTPLAQKLIGHSAGDEVTLEMEQEKFRYKILEITPIKQ